MPQIAPGCVGCRGSYTIERLYRRTYTDNPKSGRQKAYGWVCTFCGAIRVDKVENGKDHWVYRGIYQ